MIAARIVIALIAVVVLARTLMSAVRTFVIPRDEPTALTRAVFQAVGVPLGIVARRQGGARAFRLRRAYAPMAVLMLPVVWLFTTWAAFGVFYWAIGEGDIRAALEISGSAVTSLGIHRPDGFGATLVAFGEGALGLGLVALLITYLPTIYGAYQRREAQVSLLAVRAGTPPSAVEMLARFQQIGLLVDTVDLWAGWEAWFVEVEESHTSMGMLAFFQSGLPNQSWITASGAALDGASLLLSSVDVPFEPRAALCIRSGWLALRHVADFFDIGYEPNPSPTDPIAISRAEFDDALARLDAVGVPLKADRDQAWRDFAGWRVNYDTVLLALCGLVSAPSAPWSADRATPVPRLPLTRRAGRGQGTRSAHERAM